MDVKAYSDTFTIVKEREDYSLKEYLGRNCSIVKIPEGVTRISAGAFRHHDGIKTIVFPKTLIRIPDSLCAWWEELEEVVIPEGVTSIGRDAFVGTSITEITIPSTVDRIGTGAFNFCKKLSTIFTNHMSSSLLASFFYSDYESIESKSIRERHYRELQFKIYLGNRDGLEFSQFFRYYEPSLEGKAKFEIKELFVVYNNYVIGYIGTDSRLTIPDSVIGICFEAFAGNHEIQSVTMGAKVKSIGWSAFENCISLKTVVLNKNLEQIGDFAFRNTGIENITIPAKVTYVGESVFNNCRHIQNVIIESKIGDYRTDRWDLYWNNGLYGKWHFNTIF